jgi:hypothetical protein
MARSDLLRQLIASPHALPPPQPRALTVAPTPGLQPHAGFGPTNPSLTTNSPFSGAVTAGGAMNMVHPEAGPTFQSPTYAPIGPVSPHLSILSALAPILSAALAGGTGATGGGGGGGTGLGTTPGPGFPRPMAAGVLASPTLSPAPGRPGPRGAPGSSGGLQPVSPALSAGLLAALAQQGQRLGSVRPPGGNIIRM